MNLMPKKLPSVPAMIVSTLVAIIALSLFTTWGYQWVSFVLSKMFNVETTSTVYDLFIGLIAMFSSVLVFIGAIHVWMLKRSSAILMIVGSVGFILKNLLEVVNDVHPLQIASSVTPEMISTAAWAIGFDIFQVAFWIFVLVFFNRHAFRKTLN
jgi:hypothetical protein